MGGFLDRLRASARRLKADALTLWFAARDPRCPRSVRLLALVVAGYAFSPIDLIPDAIPILGLLDDLVLVPAGLWLALKLLPAEVIAEARARAAVAAARPVSRLAAAAIIAFWLLSAVGVTLLVVD